ncbi:hypothetical protein SDRG_03933 [Saprolegnia diclina VS20]|uniref:EF-hand domain-containing protein n=1 Tax=Saprolegnia diclina (strain VS20) TaxID=1156394 RepID=T0QY78_SAPDV|nr:hypothetical protein SDRG_03933 [Saprolegnia diclina VS20]EQC38980.1 hypothetical protein SDRG_03933 [Saprolegnia diclina VS20]|eukprot:XP_008607804.1 hypothetical protein SDRG_03933 [Saprolegnia diclina VS20]
MSRGKRRNKPKRLGGPDRGDEANIKDTDNDEDAAADGSPPSGAANGASSTDTALSSEAQQPTGTADAETSSSPAEPPMATSPATDPSPPARIDDATTSAIDVHPPSTSISETTTSKSTSVARSEARSETTSQARSENATPMSETPVSAIPVTPVVQASAVSGATTVDSATAVAAEKRTLSNTDVADRSRRLLTRPEAERIVQHLVFGLLKASVPLVSLLKPRPTLQELAFQLQAECQIGLTSTDLQALHVYFHVADTNMFDAASCLAFAATKVFVVELYEFQLRKAILEKATKLRGKADVPRTLLQLLPDTTTSFEPADLNTLAVEKLGLPSSPHWVLHCVIGRIARAGFEKAAPKTPPAYPLAAFRRHLGQFVARAAFDPDSVEGALRSLVQADAVQGFLAIDTDGSGTLSLDECTTYLQAQHFAGFPRGVLRDFMARFDRDGDGTLNLDEFLAVCRPKEQFGLQVVTPFGSFYMAMPMMTLVKDLVPKLHKRMFWLQHNHMLGNADPSTAGKMLVSVDRFVIQRHFGALPLVYGANDTVQSILMPGELLVVMETTPTGPSLVSKEKYIGKRVAPLQRPLAAVPAPNAPVEVETTPAAMDLGALRRPRPPKPTLSLSLPPDVSAWTPLDVKKWVIYDLKLPTLAAKVSQVDGNSLLGLARTPSALEKTLTHTFHIHLPLQRLQLQQAILRLLPPSATTTTRQKQAKARTSCRTKTNSTPQREHENHHDTGAEVFLADNAPMDPAGPNNSDDRGAANPDNRSVDEEDERSVVEEDRDLVNPSPSPPRATLRTVGSTISTNEENAEDDEDECPDALLVRSSSTAAKTAGSSPDLDGSMDEPAPRFDGSYSDDGGSDNDALPSFAAPHSSRSSDSDDELPVFAL